MAKAPPENDPPKTPAPTLSIDWELYGHHLDESDLTDAEKREFIETLWYLMVSFVDLGFEVSSPKSAERGKLTDSFNSGSDNQTKKDMPTPQKKEETNAIR